MNDKQNLLPGVGGALDLDGDPESIKRYYAKWANDYDDDIRGGYPGPEILTNLLYDVVESFAELTPLSDPQTAIMDAGCGTGMVGKLLNDRGYRNIDGTDLSPEMVEIARELNIYKELTGDVDLMQPLPAEWKKRYDIVVCCGVFTLGHVPAEMLYQLFDMTRENGLVVTSTRLSYFNASEYQSVNDEAIDTGKVRLLKQLNNAPYTEDSEAHYWVYSVN